MDICKDGDFTASLGNLWQCLTAHMVGKKIILISEKFLVLQLVRVASSPSTVGIGGAPDSAFTGLSTSQPQTDVRPAAGAISPG